MRKIDQYMSTIDTLYPDGFVREVPFRDSGDMVDQAPVPVVKAGLLARAAWAVWMWHIKRSSRLTLRDLDHSQLRDIGITREQAVIEASKSYFPFR